MSRYAGKHPKAGLHSFAGVLRPPGRQRCKVRFAHARQSESSLHRVQCDPDRGADIIRGSGAAGHGLGSRRGTWRTDRRPSHGSGRGHGAALVARQGERSPDRHPARCGCPSGRGPSHLFDGLGGRSHRRPSRSGGSQAQERSCQGELQPRGARVPRDPRQGAQQPARAPRAGAGAVPARQLHPSADQSSQALVRRRLLGRGTALLAGARHGRTDPGRAQRATLHPVLPGPQASAGQLDARAGARHEHQHLHVGTEREYLRLAVPTGRSSARQKRNRRGGRVRRRDPATLAETQVPQLDPGKGGAAASRRPDLSPGLFGRRVRRFELRHLRRTAVPRPEGADEHAVPSGPSLGEWSSLQPAMGTAFRGRAPGCAATLGGWQLGGLPPDRDQRGRSDRRGWTELERSGLRQLRDPALVENSVHGRRGAREDRQAVDAAPLALGGRPSIVRPAAGVLGDRGPAAVLHQFRPA